MRLKTTIFVLVHYDYDYNTEIIKAYTTLRQAKQALKRIIETREDNYYDIEPTILVG